MDVLLPLIDGLLVSPISTISKDCCDCVSMCKREIKKSRWHINVHPWVKFYTHRCTAKQVFAIQGIWLYCIAVVDMAGCNSRQIKSIG